MLSAPSPWRSVLAVTGVVLAIHVALIGVYLTRGHDVRDLARVSPRYAQQSASSETITPHVLGLSDSGSARDANGLGYDGQFNYFMALDPRGARRYMDDPAYRYSRVLYAALSRLVAAGDSSAIPLALLVVNWLAIGLGTAAFALLMVRRQSSAWLALLFGLAPGLVLAVHRDLTEPLAYALVLLAVLTMASGRSQRLLGAGVLFGLAGLARQTTLLFPLVYGAALLLRRRHELPRPTASVGAPPIAGFFALSFVPYIVWALVLHGWLGRFPTGEQWLTTPFGWLFEPDWAWSRQPAEIVGVVIPTMLWLAVVVHAGRRRSITPALACAGIAAIAFVVFAPPYSGYPGAGRAVLAVAIPALLAAPTVAQLKGWVRRAYWLAVVCWMSVLPGVALVDLLDVKGPVAG